MMVGERLRDVRQSQHRSLTDVATQAGISAATLSRIETSKQGIDLALFLTLTRILKAVPHEILDDAEVENNADPLVRKIAALGSEERVRMWRDLAAARRSLRTQTKASGGTALNQQVEELAAQLEYVQEEFESVRAGMKRRR